jgi:aryl-alcohol dehydrogenase-like predicted oxidoreductase
MYAISIEQSHATEILTRLRPWPCRFWHTDHRGLLLIHARTPKLAKGVSSRKQEYRTNALVGVVDLMDCIASTRLGDDPDEVEYQWLLANPRTFAKPIPYAGRLGLFLVSEKVAAAALRQVGTPHRLLKGSPFEGTVIAGGTKS